MKNSPSQLRTIIIYLFAAAMTVFLCAGTIAIFAIDRLPAPIKEGLALEPTLTPAATIISRPSVAPGELPTTKPAVQPYDMPAASSSTRTPTPGRGEEPPASRQGIPTPQPPPIGSPTGEPAISPDRRAADLVILPSTGITGGPLKRGQSFKAVVDGANKGGTDASDIPIKVDVQMKVFAAFVTAYTYHEVLPAIKAGETVRREVSGTLPDFAMPGTYRVKIVLDPANTIPELDEGNNTMTMDVALQ